MSDVLLRINAWGGAAAEGCFGPASLAWAVRPGVPGPPQMAGPAPIDLARWEDPRVGWGLVVPDSDAPAPDKARGLDLPEALQSLLQQRGNAPVLRWRADLPEGRLRRYDASGTPADLRLSGARGIAPLAVPRYLAIAASPAQIPWRAQFRLQTEAFVGRIDLDEAALGRYIDALVSDWSGTDAPSRSKPVVWAADHGHPDITRLMRKTIAERLAQAFASDADGEFDMAQGLLVDANASGASLLQALAERQPAFVMTSSHGATFPLDDAALLRAQLGVPVDQSRQLLDLQALSGWNPAGAIWYAHACCSAGADARSSFSGIFDPASTLATTLDAIASAGACQAPLPRALLGAAQPARAFIGHVEPTFDWTLRDPVTGQSTTQSLIESFYDGLHARGGMPVGLALHAHFDAVAGLLLDHGDALQAVNDLVPGAQERARRAKLMAMDRLAMVILGDPTVRLAAPA